MHYGKMTKILLGHCLIRGDNENTVMMAVFTAAKWHKGCNNEVKSLTFQGEVYVKNPEVTFLKDAI